MEGSFEKSFGYRLKVKSQVAQKKSARKEQVRSEKIEIKK